MSAGFFGLVLALAPISALAQKVPPKPLETPSPGYPEELTDTGLSGRAEVDIVVKADGSVGEALLGMADHRAFGKKALAVVKTWKFTPGTQNGQPADMKVAIPFNFNPPADQQINAIAKRKVFVELPQPAIPQAQYGAKLKVKREPNLSYPRNVRGDRKDERVEVKFVIAPDGTTLNPEVVGSPRKEFVTPALIAIANTHYEPVAKGGQPVYVETTKTLKFSEDRGGRGFPNDMGGGGGGGGRGFGGGGGGGGGGGDGPDYR